MKQGAMMYYNNGPTLGVVGTVPAHRDGDHTYLPGLRHPWIRTADLYQTEIEAERAPVAQFYGLNRN